MISPRSIALQGFGASVALLIAVQGFAPISSPPPEPPPPPPPSAGSPVYGVNTYYDFKGAFNPTPPSRPKPVKTEPTQPPTPKKPTPDRPPPKPEIVEEDDTDDEEVLAVIEAWLTVRQDET